MTTATFQAIRYNNTVVENFGEREKPQTILGAAQGYFSGFDADYSAFSLKDLKKAWIDDEVLGFCEKYNDVSLGMAREEAKIKLKILRERTKR